MMGRSVVKPIERVTRAMARVAGGEFGRRVPVSGRDELGRMALSFNAMTDELERTYEGLTREQNKLTTIIRSAAEGVVVTDGEGRVVLVNPAAEALLGKSVAEIAAAGLPMLLDDAAAMDEWLRAGQGATPRTVAYKGRVLQVFASTIHDANDAVTGSAVLLRDVTAASRLTEELLRLSHTDGLTGLFNRRHFDEILVAEYLRAQRSRRPLALVVCDVDHFKRFNDVHGHDQGDRVLKFVAGLLQADLRGYDAACRYGGEEFVLVLPDADLAAGRAVAERVRRMVEHSEIDGLRVTISLGVAALPAAGCDSPQGLFAAADAALYRAKQDGRNRVRAAADAPVAAATPA
jgi:diguanylate cyclase (GGDEF)-like protein/PAS domain S-box-containing protein